MNDCVQLSKKVKSKYSYTPHIGYLIISNEVLSQLFTVLEKYTAQPCHTSYVDPKHQQYASIFYQYIWLLYSYIRHLQPADPTGAKIAK